MVGRVMLKCGPCCLFIYSHQTWLAHSFLCGTRSAVRTLSSCCCCCCCCCFSFSSSFCLVYSDFLNLIKLYSLVQRCQLEEAKLEIAQPGSTKTDIWVGPCSVHVRLRLGSKTLHQECKQVGFGMDMFFFFIDLVLNLDAGSKRCVAFRSSTNLEKQNLI